MRSVMPTAGREKLMNNAQQSSLWTPAIRSAKRTSCGKVRSINEDRILARPEIGLWAVADGMGGHRAGDYAAQRLVDALDHVTPHASAFTYLNATLETIRGVNAALVDESARNPQRKGMGTTLVALLVYDAHVACIWAGDSRAYRWRDGTLEQLTTDHSLVQALIDHGEIDAHERQRHPQSHVITKAIGVFPDLELDKTFSMILPGDKFLICSDGLSNCIPDEVLADELAVPMEVSLQADALLHTAMETKAADNISFVLLHA